MKSKVFHQSLHDENDPPAREAVKKVYARLGHTLLDNPDKYGVDLVDADRIISVEVERRLIWDKDDFPFAEVNFLQRKAKFFVATPFLLADYAIVSKDLKRVGVVDSLTIIDTILTTPLVENPNRYVHDSEFFYKIPKSSFTWITI